MENVIPCKWKSKESQNSNIHIRKNRLQNKYCYGRQRYYILIKGSNQGDITIVNIYARVLRSKESTENRCILVGDAGSFPGSGRSPEAGNGNPLQYSCLENLMDRGSWQATVHRVTQRLKQLSTQLRSTLMYKAKNEQS